MNIGKSVEKLEGYSKIADFGSGVIWPNFRKIMMHKMCVECFVQSPNSGNTLTCLFLKYKTINHYSCDNCPEIEIIV